MLWRRAKAGQNEQAAAPGGSALARIGLASISMLFAWCASCVFLVFLQLTFEPGLELKSLSIWSGCVALVSLLLFALPLTATPSRTAQLRFGPLVVLASLGYSVGFFRLFFQEWPWTSFHEGWPAQFFLLWIAGFTLCASGTYILLLSWSARRHTNA